MSADHDAPTPADLRGSPRSSYARSHAMQQRCYASWTDAEPMGPLATFCVLYVQHAGPHIWARDDDQCICGASLNDEPDEAGACAACMADPARRAAAEVAYEAEMVQRYAAAWSA